MIDISDFKNHPPPFLIFSMKKLGNYCGGEPRSPEATENSLVAMLAAEEQTTKRLFVMNNHCFGA